MPVPDRIVMGTGYCNPYPEATAALSLPMVGHLDPEFVSALDETCDRLRTVWGTTNPLTLPVSGTGSAGMEAAFVNLVGPLDGVNGLFGERMCGVASRCGADVVQVDAPWGEALDPDAVLRAHRRPKLIALVHAGLGAVLDEGLDAAWARHQACGQLLQDGLEKLGMELWAEAGHRLPELTTVVIPDGADDAWVRQQLLQEYSIEIGGGVGPSAGKVWRIGCMGHTARRRNVTLLLAALGELLAR